MSDFTTFELIRKLEGSIEPQAEAHFDEIAYRNLREWMELHNAITDEILTAADHTGLMCYASAEKIVLRARDYIKECYERLGEFIEAWDSEKRGDT